MSTMPRVRTPPILAMAAFVEQILPRAPDDEWPVAMRLLSQPQSRTEGTSLDARDADKNPHIWNAKLIMATTGLHLAQFQHKYRPLAKAVDYAELFIYDEAQQEAALSDLAILGALPRKCLVLRLGDPKQTSGGTGPSELARQVRLISDQLALGIRAPRTPYLPQACRSSSSPSSLTHCTHQSLCRPQRSQTQACLVRMMGGPALWQSTLTCGAALSRCGPTTAGTCTLWLSSVACRCDGTLRETRMPVRVRLCRTTGRSCCLFPSVCKPGSMPSWQSVAIVTHWS